MIGKRALALVTALCLLGPPLAVRAAGAEDAAWDVLPAFLAEEPAEEGTVELLGYMSRVPGGRDAVAGVYLPPGYDPEKRYDALLLWPGTGGDHEDVLLAEYSFSLDSGEVRELSAPRVLDRMVETGLIRPLILVCMQDTSGGEMRIAQKDLSSMLDTLGERYAVYTQADGLTPEELRSHYILFGFSLGAIYAQSAGLGLLFDRFGSFASLSYGTRWKYVCQAVNESPFPMGFLYVLAGNETDFGAPRARQGYELITRGCPDKVREGDNALLRETELYGHGYELVTLGLWDLLPRILPPGEAGAEGTPEPAVPGNGG